MEMLRYKSVCPNDKPMWLIKLQMAINNTYSLRGVEDTEDEWKQLKDFVDWFISKLYVRKDIAVKSDISTYLMREEGQTQLLIKRNGKLIQTYYIQN